MMSKLRMIVGGALSVVLCATAAWALEWDGEPHTRGRFMAEIDWEAVENHARLPEVGLRPSHIETLAMLDLPVMLPSNLEGMADATIVTGDGWYVVNVHRPDHFVMIYGTKVTFHEPHYEISFQPGVGWEERLTSRQHKIVNQSFRSFGAAYSVEVSCRHDVVHGEDARCASNAYIDALGRSMSVLGATE